MIKDFKKVGIRIFLASCNPAVRGIMRREEISKKYKEDIIFVDVPRAVKAACSE